MSKGFTKKKKKESQSIQVKGWSFVFKSWRLFGVQESSKTYSAAKSQEEESRDHYDLSRWQENR